jgi:uncharacterized tellurite resistance protein B-like protein
VACVCGLNRRTGRSSFARGSSARAKLYAAIGLLLRHDREVSLLRFFGIGAPEPERQTAAPPQTETVRKIVDALDRLEPERARYLAAFGYILSRVARADLKVSPDETRAMERAVIAHGGLTEEQAIIAIQIAKHQNALFGGTEDFLVTREFNKIAAREQKLELLDCLYSVAAAEQSISVAEDNEIRKIASELGIEHPDIIQVRTRYRDKLAVLQQGT